MAIVRWNPLDDLLGLQKKMNKIFEESFLSRKASEDEEMSSGLWVPAVDIYETGSDIVLKAELPEINQKDIQINIEDNVLTLKGERKFEKETKEENYHRIERSYGSFSRSFTLPGSVDKEKVKASYKNGVLKITMPKKEESKPKQVTIDVD